MRKRKNLKSPKKSALAFPLFLSRMCTSMSRPKNAERTLARLLLLRQQQQINKLSTKTAFQKREHLQPRCSFASSFSFSSSSPPEKSSASSNSMSSSFYSSSSPPHPMTMTRMPRNRYEFVRAYQTTRELRRMAKQRYTRIERSKFCTSNFHSSNHSSNNNENNNNSCLLYTSPSPRDATLSRMPSSA